MVDALVADAYRVLGHLLSGNSARGPRRRSPCWRAVEPETAVITDCALTKASGPDTHDAAMAAQLLTDEATPVPLLGDSAMAAEISVPT